MSFIAAELCQGHQSSGSDVTGKQPRLSWPVEILAYIFSTVYQVEMFKALNHRNDFLEN